MVTASTLGSIRRKVILFSLMLLANNISNAQFFDLKYKDIEPAVIVASYSLKYQRDSTNPNNIRNSSMLLFIGRTMSKFVNSANYISDTTTRKFTTEKQIVDYMSNPQRQPVAFVYEIYKNYPKGKLTFTDVIPSDMYKYEEDLNLFEWTITNDTATFCSYKAQKATCDFGGRSWIAWFSPDIPYSDGPYKFNGLPGLIVKVYDTRNHYVFELLSLGKPGKSVMIDIEDKDYLVTTKQGFFQAEDSFKADIVNRAREAGGDNQMQQTAAKNMAQRNNPIELKRK
jgi:GLPGLI family protein